MSLRLLFPLGLVLLCWAVQQSAARWNAHQDDNDDEYQYRLLKRFLFHKDSTTSTQRTPSIFENLIRPSSTRHSTERIPTGTQKSTHSPSGSGVCSNNPCEHAGICIAKGSASFECKCVGPWRGLYCGIADACYRSPCQNGGTCLNVHDDYWCKCTSDYYGTNCQSKFSNPSSSNDNCRPNICNTGRCVSLQTTYYCQCPNDRYGEHCEKRFSKRRVSDLQLYSDLWDQMKRGMSKEDLSTLEKPQQRAEDVAFYDVKNRIYF